MQAALHQQLAFGLMDQLDRLGRRSVAVGYVHDLVLADVDLVLARDGGDLRFRPHQNRHDDAGFGGLGRTAQGGLVTGMHHDRFRGRRTLRFRNQAVVLRAGPLAGGNTSYRSNVTVSLGHDPDSLAVGLPGFDSNSCWALVPIGHAYCWSMIFSENRYPPPITSGAG